MRKFLLAVLAVLISYANAVNLTEKEKRYLNTHSFTCTTTATWAPFNTYLDNGKFDGISVDILRLIEKRTDLKAHCKILPHWSEVLNEIKNGVSDFTFSTDKTPDKAKYALFSKPYATFNIGIATRNNVGFIASTDLLKNKTIAVGKNYTANFLINKHLKDVKIIQTATIKEALKLVSEGKAFAVIDVMPVLIYNINKYEFANLKIAGKTPWKFDLRFMVSKNDPMLVNIINKGIDTITDEEKEKIYKEWVSVIYQNGYSLKEIITFFAVLAFILLISVYWNLKLKKEIRHRETLEKELKKLSIIDSLTGIYNRYKIDTTLNQQIAFSKRHKTPLSIIFFDIDHFKKINDTYGHNVGDIVLKELTMLVKNNIREYDIFGRWGGEEFIIILPNTTLKNAVIIAKKLKNVIENNDFSYIGKLTCSFGVTELKENDTAESFLVRVDNLLYTAKKSGRNTVISDSEEKN
jgi:polar amino acid transport system substrate-binding protein